MKKTKTICFANNKGGSGKSTTCSNVGYGLRELGTADGRDYEYEDLQKLSELDKKALRERRVINSTIAAKKTPG